MPHISPCPAPRPTLQDCTALHGTYVHLDLTPFPLMRYSCHRPQKQRLTPCCLHNSLIESGAPPSYTFTYAPPTTLPTYSLPLLPLSRRRKDPGKHTRGHSGERGPPPARATHAVVEREPPSPSIPVRFVLYDAHPSGYTHLRKAAASERRPKLQHDSSMPCTPHAVVSDCWHGMRIERGRGAVVFCRASFSTGNEGRRYKVCHARAVSCHPRENIK